MSFKMITISRNVWFLYLPAEGDHEKEKWNKSLLFNSLSLLFKFYSNPQHFFFFFFFFFTVIISQLEIMFSKRCLCQYRHVFNVMDSRHMNTSNSYTSLCPFTFNAFSALLFLGIHYISTYQCKQRYFMC